MAKLKNLKIILKEFLFYIKIKKIIIFKNYIISKKF